MTRSSSSVARACCWGCVEVRAGGYKGVQVQTGTAEVNSNRATTVWCVAMRWRGVRRYFRGMGHQV